MKKLLSLFAISSITLTAAGSSVACGVNNKTNPIRRSNVVYKMLPSKAGDWAAGSDYSVDLTKATTKVGGKTLTGLYLKTGDKVTISFLPTAGSTAPATYTKQSITLGTTWTPDTITAAFKITFNKSNFAVKHSGDDAVEIDITLNRIDSRKTNIAYKNTPIPPVTTPDWAINKGYTVDVTKATAKVGSDTFIGLNFKTGDKVTISFLPTVSSASPVTYTNESITLGTAWKPISGPTSTFTITFNKSNFVVAHSNEAAVEIDITLNRIDPRKTNIAYKNTPILPATIPDWAEDKSYTVDITKATATVGSDTFTGFNFKTRDKIKISFKRLGGSVTAYTKNSIRLGKAWQPVSIANTFTITFNKLNFVVTHSREAAVEIDITLLTS